MGPSRRLSFLPIALAILGYLRPALAQTEDANGRVPAHSDSTLDSYTLHVRLDQAEHQLSGRGELVWTNRSRVPVRELYWHMYLNAFRDQKTFFFRSPSLRARSHRSLSTKGSIAFTELRISAPYAESILANVATHSPNDPEDQTDLRVALPRAVAPGETLVIQLAFLSQLPAIVERTGVSRDFTLAGQWFPKLAVLEQDGHWEHFRFHPFSEFYADFANYDVTLDVPQNMVVGATGRLVDTQRVATNSLTDAAGQQPFRRLHYTAPAVHDFAWTSWPHFQSLKAQVDDTEILILYPPGHQRNAEVTLQTLQQALPHFEERFGPYPHSTLTVVHPPVHAAPAGGMEYPSFITTGGAWYYTYLSRAVETVTIHELAHQWFQGSLASNEHRWPFLDEGLASYAESRESARLFGAGSLLSVAGWQWSTLAEHRANLLLEEHDDPMGSAAANFESFDELGAVIYSRSILLMQTLANVYGQELLDELLLRYSVRFAGRHPTLDDFLSELSPLGEQAVQNITAALEHGSTVDFTLRDLQSKPGRNNEIVSTVTIERTGNLSFPVEILLEFADGQQRREQWSGEQLSHTLEVRGNSHLVRAWVDPDARILLDENLANNVIALEPSFPINYFERLLYAVQLSLAWFLS